MFTFFRNCQIQSEKTQAVNAAREALAREGESSYQARPAPPVCWQVLHKSEAPASTRMKWQRHTALTVPQLGKERAQNRAQGWKGCWLTADRAGTAQKSWCRER